MTDQNSSQKETSGNTFVHDEQRKKDEAALRCPFTHVDKDFGHSVWITKNDFDLWFVGCDCGYRGPVMATAEQASRAHCELIDLRNTRHEHTEAIEKIGEHFEEMKRLYEESTDVDNLVSALTSACQARLVFNEAFISKHGGDV